MPSGLPCFFLCSWYIGSLCPVGYRVFLFDALGISDLMPSGLPVFFLLDALGISDLMPSGLPCFLFDALGISDLMSSGLPVFFV